MYHGTDQLQWGTVPARTSNAQSCEHRRPHRLRLIPYSILAKMMTSHTPTAPSTRCLEIKEPQEVPQLIVSELVRQYLYDLDMQLRYNSIPIAAVNELLQWSNFPKAVRAYANFAKIKATTRILVENRSDIDQYPEIKAMLLTMNPFSHDIKNALADTHSLKRKLEVILPEFPFLKSVQSSKKKRDHNKSKNHGRFNPQFVPYMPMQPLMQPYYIPVPVGYPQQGTPFAPANHMNRQSFQHTQQPTGLQNSLNFPQGHSPSIPNQFWPGFIH
ncbi:hypothetical protein BKA69DRAFT_735841 [Paraphysoderma sedebokerense]|nr:hypothetical protein BKA69DRAFT_735841 [Paraphysoderma sedebokerense]